MASGHRVYLQTRIVLTFAGVIGNTFLPWGGGGQIGMITGYEVRIVILTVPAGGGVSPWFVGPNINPLTGLNAWTAGHLGQTTSQAVLVSTRAGIWIPVVGTGIGLMLTENQAGWAGRISLDVNYITNQV